MGRKGGKYTPDQRLRIAKEVSDGIIAVSEAMHKYDLTKATIQYLTALYKAQGDSAFKDNSKNNVYSPELKLQAVTDYLDGKGSLMTIASRYGLRSKVQLEKWIKMYNNGIDFSHRMSGGSRMKASRSTTKEERIKIVKECIANGCNYGETAIKHNVSYQQVYGWVKRFKELGEAGLEDRRGKRKMDQEPRSEVEKLQIEIEKLKHQLYLTEIERDLLKKVRELEREDLYRK